MFNKILLITVLVAVVAVANARPLTPEEEAAAAAQAAQQAAQPAAQQPAQSAPGAQPSDAEIQKALENLFRTPNGNTGPDFPVMSGDVNFNGGFFGADPYQNRPAVQAPVVPAGPATNDGN